MKRIAESAANRQKGKEMEKKDKKHTVMHSKRARRENGRKKNVCKDDSDIRRIP